MTPTKYELETHEGRKICESRELGGGYCGSCSIEIHVEQMRDPKGWVHSSAERWHKAYLEAQRTVANTLDTGVIEELKAISLIAHSRGHYRAAAIIDNIIETRTEDDA